MIPRSQHFRDRAPFPCDRSGIMRIFEKPALEALLLSAGGRAHYPGKQPNASVEQDKSADLAAGEDIVADRDGDDGPGLEQPLVDALETAAEDGDSGAGGKLADQSLGERSSARGHGEEGRFRTPG